MRTRDKVRTIVNTMCDQYNINVISIKGKSRLPIFKEPRQLAMHFIYKYTKLTMVESASTLNRHHATLYHANKMIDGWRETDKRFRYKYELFDELIKNKING